MVRGDGTWNADLQLFNRQTLIGYYLLRMELNSLPLRNSCCTTAPLNQYKPRACIYESSPTCSILAFTSSTVFPLISGTVSVLSTSTSSLQENKKKYFCLPPVDKKKKARQTIPRR